MSGRAHQATITDPLIERHTILLDEIGELSPALQAKLLQVLQDGEFTRLGVSYKTLLNKIKETGIEPPPAARV